ncbi:hypothetical protein BH11BAC3_BH11BAC3_35570 [soil metagenome]
MFTTYILHSPQLDKYYIGFTSGEILVRLQKHLSNHKGFTAKAKDWHLVFLKHLKQNLQAWLKKRN